MLSKGLNKFPGGAANRWGEITAFLQKNGFERLLLEKRVRATKQEIATRDVSVTDERTNERTNKNPKTKALLYNGWS